ncbi:hypothetical protein NLJ89_g6858 [Agrocybe chaxingu]|uniref:C-8 sterol isomerase n=1 Tax=Agrocybe chaxingu TaxID=84603 RepID=A0A9W8K5L8_9AGAR|nr:hypothetical protein NLJ89_g6858 [Agrocybe chaxingu]
MPVVNNPESPSRGSSMTEEICLHGFLDFQPPPEAWKNTLLTMSTKDSPPRHEIQLSRNWLITWARRLFILVVIIATLRWLDRIKHRWYIFDPKLLHELAQSAVATYPNDARGMITHIVSNLTETYPPAQIRLNTHEDITEYLIIFGTPLGTEGHSGVHTADDYFHILIGEEWAFRPGSLEMERYTPGMVNFQQRGAVKQYKMHEGCFALEYARGWIPPMLPFGFLDTFTSTLDFPSLYNTVRITGREMLGNLFIAKI